MVVTKSESPVFFNNHCFMYISKRYVFSNVDTHLLIKEPIKFTAMSFKCHMFLKIKTKNYKFIISLI